VAEPQDRPDIQIFTEIGIIAQLTRVNVAKKLPDGVNYAQFEVLQHLARTGDGQTPAEIARALQLTKGAITNSLQRMQAAGYLVVLADVADGRKKRVKLTRQGIDLKGDILKRIKPNTDALRDGFTEGEFRDALPFLKALRAFLDDMRSDDGPNDEARPALDADHLDCSA
jgi:DNA-binding MarR family transcriptional regulator